MKTEFNIQLLTIYHQVCDHFQTRPHYEPIRVRQVAQYVAFKRVPVAKQIIGQVIGGRDGHTVANSIRRIEELIEPINGRAQDENLKTAIFNLTNIKR